MQSEPHVMKTYGVVEGKLCAFISYLGGELSFTLRPLFPSRGFPVLIEYVVWLKRSVWMWR